MTSNDLPVTEDELHAYVDGELPADRRKAVASWLAAHPSEAATVAAWRAQAEAIRARYGSTLDEPVPARLKLDQIMRQSGGRGRSFAAIAAAAVLAFVIGGGAGWLARGAAAAPSGVSTITADALEAHKLYVVEVRHPVEVPGSERPHLTAWLSKRLGYAQHIPDLQSIGLKLVGGRLLPGPNGDAAALYMYEGPSGERFTVYSSEAKAPQTALRFKTGNRFAAFYWVDDQHAYVVSGPAERAKLERISKMVYEQVDKSGAKRS
jgi:anti-sigma factor RsiW